MISLSTPVKEAIKTSLAVVIAYAIALHLGWDKPYWGAFTVLMISLDSAGQSLNKGALRMLGTFVGGTAAFVLMALFPQDRWSMMLGLSGYYGFCTYMMTGSKRPYFWFVSAFVCMIIMVDVSPLDSLRVFQVVVTRVQETAMGILVYSVISALLWPRSSQGDLEEASRLLATTQQQLYRTYRGLMAGQDTAQDSRALRMQEVQLLGQLGQALNAAEKDSYAVFEIRHQWRRFHALATALMESLERWRESFPEIQALDLPKLLPDLEAVCSEIDWRFQQIAGMLAGETPERMPQPVTLTVDKTATRSLTHFQKAALALTKAQLDRLETLSRSLFDCAADIKGFASQSGAPHRAEGPAPGPTLDPDRFAGALRVMAAQWIGFLIWVYIDPPGHAVFVYMTAQWTLTVVMMRTNPLVLLPGFMLGIVLGGGVYIFVMPHLSGYVELGLMLFGVTFGAFYLLRAPRHGATKSFSMALFHVVLGIQNEQTYNFAAYANTSAAILLSFALVVVIFYVPTSPRPEKVFLRQLRRYFRQAEFLMSRLALDRDENKGLATRWRIALYRNDLLELPEKLAALGQRIDYRLLSGQTPEQVQALATSLQTLAYRIKELVDARELAQADLLVEAVIDDVRAWRLVAQEQLRLWADDPAFAAEAGVDIRDRLTARISKLEARIDETLGDAGEGTLREEDYENFYRYLGAFRGLTESGIEYSRLAGGINWAQWKETRF